MTAFRRTILAITAAGLMLATPAVAKALTVGEALNMLVAFRNLDGRATVVKENVVIQPWEFGSGTLRLRIAKNITALAEVERTADEARQSIIKELLRKMPQDTDGKPATSIAQGSAEFEEFNKQYAALLKEPAAVNLSRIKASELRLDKNEIPTSTLAAMAAVLDDDVSSK